MVSNTPLQIGGTEWLWIVFLAIILLFGSKRIPELSRAIGRAMGEFQRGRDEIEREFRRTMALTGPPPTPARPAAPATPTTQPTLLSRVLPKSRVEKAAEDLGVDTRGKGEEELKAEMRRLLEKLEKKTPSEGESINIERKGDVRE